MAKEKDRQHPTQKPLALMNWCIGLAGDVRTILDPFAGSGTTAVAAKSLGRKCVCVEREERYCEIAAKRCAQGVLPLYAEKAVDRMAQGVVDSRHENKDGFLEGIS
jgi:DNA modification methylase